MTARSPWDLSSHPVSPGHALLVPRRHIVDWLEVDQSERSELTAAIGLAQKLIQREHDPTSFRLHMDWGAGAGQEAPHLQLQVVPRYRPDQSLKHLTTGDSNDPFWSALLPLLDRARLVDIAVAFVQPSGLDLMEPLFRQLLRQSGQLRLITGDSLGVTDPDALMRLLDLTESHLLDCLRMRFVFLGPRFCLQLPSHPTSR